MRKEFSRKIAVYGSKKDVEYTMSILSNLNLVDTEYENRRIISSVIDDYKIKADILYNGNTVYGINTMVKKFKTLFKSNDMNKLTKDCYNYLHLACGSIAHYNKTGWIYCHPTINDLRQFFKENEYGKDIVSNCPHWAYDRIEINKQLLTL